MKTRVVHDVSTLPNVTFGSRSIIWWGTLGFMITEGMTLVICAFAYLYLRKNFFTFPPRATPLPSLGVPIAQLILMAITIGPMWYAARAARTLDLQRTRVALSIEVVLKVGVLILRWFEFKALNTQWNSDAYGSVAWVTLGFHATLLILDFFEDVGFVIILWSGRTTMRNFSDVMDDAMYWYFTVLAWIPLFIMIFLYPRWT